MPEVMMRWLPCFNEGIQVEFTMYTVFMANVFQFVKLKKPLYKGKGV